MKIDLASAPAHDTDFHTDQTKTLEIPAETASKLLYITLTACCRFLAIYKLTPGFNLASVYVSELLDLWDTLD